MADTLTPAPRRSFRRALALIAATIGLLALAALLAVVAGQRYLASRLAPDPTTVARASLEGLREQNRLSAFAARFVAVVTSRRSVLGFSDEKTLILPGNVRYEVDLSRLRQSDLRYDATSRTLSVTLPPVEADQPQVDLSALHEYGSGGVLSRLTNADQSLDAANRTAAQAELVRQANAALPMRLARDATRRAVVANFALPLRAAGVDARVLVRFADEPVTGGPGWDVSRSVDDVLHDRH